MLRAVARRLGLRGNSRPRWQVLRDEGIISIGLGTYGHETLRIPEFRLPDGSWVGSRLRIGKYCSIAPCDIFLGGNHHYERVSQFPFASIWDLPGRVDDAYSNGDVVIGNDVWLGEGSTIMSGVTVHDGAVVAARAVVVKDVRPYAVVAGNPAREVKRRFDDATVEAIRRDPWWEWPEERIRRHVDHLTQPPT